MGINLGLVGATGLVGEAFLELLEERKFKIKNLRLFASDKSRGLRKKVLGAEREIESLAPGCFAGLDLVFFSSGDDISREWAPLAVREGAMAIDNSAAFRLDPTTPLVVPEVNGELLKEVKSPRIIANPNCSTIQLVLALKPLADRFGLEQIQVASYQAVSGAGKAAQEELLKQTQEFFTSGKRTDSKEFARSIVFNCIPQIGRFDDEGMSSEEQKIRLETKKILGLKDIKVSAWTIRVPVLNAHSEAVWVRLKSKARREDILDSLRQMSGLTLCDEFPTAIDSSGKDPVFIGRIHRDPDDELTWKFWIVADNLRKGAALNGIQIAEALF